MDPFPNNLKQGMESIDQIASLCQSDLEAVRAAAREATLSFGTVQDLVLQCVGGGAGCQGPQKGVLEASASSQMRPAHGQAVSDLLTCIWPGQVSFDDLGGRSALFPS